MASVNFTSEILNRDDEIINLLERGNLNSVRDIISVEYVQEKITEFSNLFGSTYRVALLNCSKEHRENLIPLLLSLKRNVEYALNELGHNDSQNYNFRCSSCNKTVELKSNSNFFSNLQNHDHFEENYRRLMIDYKPLQTRANEVLKMQSPNITTKMDTLNLNPSSTQKNRLVKEEKSENFEQEVDEDRNSFRFNFLTGQDDEISLKLYPPRIMSRIQKYDNVNYYTIQIYSAARAACLVCCCDLPSQSIYNPNELINHALGQRHLKAVSHQPTMEQLRNYHQFWSCQKRNIQAHQVCFRLDVVDHFYCVICYKRVRIDNVISHLSDKRHRGLMLGMYSVNRKAFNLMPLLMEFYGVVYEEPVKEEEPTRRRPPKPRRFREKEVNNSRVERSINPPHDIKPSVEDVVSQNTLENLPNRMKVHKQYFDECSLTDGTKVYYCRLCTGNLANNIEAIKTHIGTTPAHEAVGDKYQYYCEICNKYEVGEINWMRHNFKGPRHLNMAETRKLRVKEYECRTCKIVIFGDSLSLARHSPSERSSKSERANRWIDLVKNMIKSKAHIQEQGEQCIRLAEEVLEIGDTKECCEQLEAALKAIYPDCKVYPFGSRASGIGDKASDLDVFFDTGAMYNGLTCQEPRDQVLLIRKVAKALESNEDYTNFVQVLSARTPILKLHHIPTKLDCDLSFKHGLSVENTRFLRYCSQLQPIAQPFMMMVKKWGKSVELDNVTTYALAMMCIFYLQVNGFLPSLEELRKIHGKSDMEIIAGWKTINYTKSLEETREYFKNYQGTLHELLRDFFKYYQKFDFSIYVVCPLLGNLIKKKLFGNPNDLPLEMEDYRTQLTTDDSETFKCTFICVQDPFDLSHNLTKAVQELTLKHFQNVCRQTANYLDTLTDNHV